MILKKKIDLAGRVMDKRRRCPKTARSKFERWILESGGTGTISRLLGVKQTTVVCWCNAQTTPNLETSIALVELSKKKLSFEDILEGTTR